MVVANTILMNTEIYRELQSCKIVVSWKFFNKETTSILHQLEDMKANPISLDWLQVPRIKEEN